MNRPTCALTTLLLAAAGFSAGAQEPAPSRAASKPRAELGIAAGALVVEGWGTGIAGGRFGVPLARRLALETNVDVMLAGGDSLGGLLRPQLRLDLGKERPGLRWFATAGGALAVCFSCGDGAAGALLPTAGVGLEKVLSPGVALRAELGALFYVGDGLTPIWMPSVGISFPIGGRPRS
jgi:hypothetical protein